MPLFSRSIMVKANQVVDGTNQQYVQHEQEEAFVAQ
jgi:hypothetical protein